VVFYQLTSGSTGKSKVIPERNAAIISHVRHSAMHCDYGSSDTTCNWLPFDHVVPMLTYHLADVYLSRAAVQLPTSDVIAEPLLWLRTMAAQRVTHSWSPNFGFKLVADALQSTCAPGGQHSCGDLSSLKLLMNAGEQVAAEVCDAFLRATGLHRTVMQPAFGMAECCTCITYNNDYSPASNWRVDKASLASNRLCILGLGELDPAGGCMAFMDLGPPSPGIEIRITAADQRTVLAEDQVGNFQIRGACVMPGYMCHPTANAECLAEDNWLDSGDLGFIHKGRLALTGRAKEMVIIFGANYYCYEVESVVFQMSDGDVLRVAATSVYDASLGTEALLVFFVPREETVPAVDVAALHVAGEASYALHTLTARITERLVSALGLTPRAIIPVLDERFHRTTSGKIQRGAFKKEFEAGQHVQATNGLSQPSPAPPLLAYTMAWPAADLPGLEETSAGNLHPMYLLAPDLVAGTVGAAVAENLALGATTTNDDSSAIGLATSFWHAVLQSKSRSRGAFVARLPSSIEEHARAIHDAELDDAISWLSEPWPIVLLAISPESQPGLNGAGRPALRTRQSVPNHFALHAALCLLQQPFLTHRTQLRPHVVLVTCGAVCVSTQSGDGVPAAADASVRGLSGAKTLEQPTLQLMLVDVFAREGAHVRASISELLNAVANGACEPSEAYHCGARRLPRLQLATYAAGSGHSGAVGPLLLASCGESPNVAPPVLITGGLGGLGLHFAGWFLARGCGPIVLVSRRGTVARDSQQLESRAELC
jgi:acyl-CoA synthetase (AMP-forming)/AMP-acid ligase II